MGAAEFRLKETTSYVSDEHASTYIDSDALATIEAEVNRDVVNDVRNSEMDMNSLFTVQFQRLTQCVDILSYILQKESNLERFGGQEDVRQFSFHSIDGRFRRGRD